MKGSQGAPPPRDSRFEDWHALVEPNGAPGRSDSQPLWRKSVPPLAARLPVGRDNLARREDAAMAAGDLESRAKLKAYQRTERTKGVVHYALIAGVCVIGGVFLLAFMAWSWHYIGPSRLHWLSAEQLTLLDRAIPYVLSLVVGGAVGRHIEKHL